MSRQQVEFLVAGADKDSGEEDLTAIRPVADGEPAQAAVLKRPSENLRTRTEFIRTELENLKYLSDADRALLLTGTGSVTWNGLPTGTFSTTQPITLKPFLAPNVSTASRLVIGLGTASQITIRTRQDGLTGQPRAYPSGATGLEYGANEISFDFTPVDTGTGAVVITVDGTPANNFHVQYDSNVTSGTLCSGLISALNGNTPFANAGLEAVMENPYPCVPPEYGFPTPPAPIIGGKVACSAGEQLRRFMSGAADAEKHNITQAHLTTFFAADGGTLNKLIEGDVLCLRYDDLTMAAYGGRRQSLDELPEDKADLAGLNLFLMRRFPERLPGALPFATVQNGLLIFVNGLALASGDTTPLIASANWYQGSRANPNSWANSTVIAAGSFEDALDNVIQALGSVTAPSGAHVVGIPAITGTGSAAGTFSTSAGGIHGAISSIVSGANAHINLGTAAHAGTAIANTVNTNGTGDPGHNISATTVQAAIDELDLEKAGLALANTFVTTNTFAEIHTTGDVGIHNAAPGAPLDITGQNKGDLVATEGDLRIGNATNRLKMGIVTVGGTSGTATITAQGGTNILALGAGTTTANQNTLQLSAGNSAVLTDYKYQAARTRSTWYGPSEFKLLTPGSENWRRGLGSSRKDVTMGVACASLEQRELQNGDINGSDTVLTLWSRAGGTSRARLVIPTRGVPTGALVTNIRVIGEVAGSPDNTVQIITRLKNRGLTSPSWSVDGPYTSSPLGPPVASAWTAFDSSAAISSRPIDHTNDIQEIQLDILLSLTAGMEGFTGSANSAQGAAASATINGGFIVTGGRDEYSSASSKETFLVDPRMGLIKPLHDMVTARSFHAQLSIEKSNATIVVGGLTHTNVAVTSAEIYFPAANRWYALGTISAPKEPHLAINSTGDGVYCIGGRLSAGTLTDLVEEVTSTGIVARAPLLGAPASLMASSWAASATGYEVPVLYITGGYRGSAATTDVYFYIPGADIWISCPSLTNARAGHAQLTLSNGSIFVAGGNATAAEMLPRGRSAWIQLAGHARLLNAAIAPFGTQQLVEVPGGVVFVTGGNPNLFYSFQTDTWTALEGLRHAGQSDSAIMQCATAVSEDGTILEYGSVLAGHMCDVYVTDVNIPSTTTMYQGIGMRIQGVAIDYTYDKVNSET